MAQKKNLTIDDLWKLERAGAPSLAPDGAQAVCALSSFSMEDNKSSSALWLLSTLGGAPRALTHCGDKDGQPRGRPRGDLIAFIAKREQQGRKDDEAQLYLIAPDGGEARRAGDVATGVEAFRWFPDGQRIAFVSWVWPELKGAAAQAKAHKAFKERKESGYVTSEAQYRYWDHHLPMGRVPHLHVLDIAHRPRARPVRGHALRAGARRPRRQRLRHLARRPAHRLRLRPRGREAAGNCFALAEIELQGPARARAGARRRLGLGRAALQPRRRAHRLHRQPPGQQAHHAGAAVRVGARERRLGGAQRRLGPRGAWPRCTGKTTARRCSSPPSSRAASTCGASTCPTAAPSCWCAAAGCSAFDKRAGTLVTLADAPTTRRACTRTCPASAAPHRALQRRAAGRRCAWAAPRSSAFEGAQGDPVQMWLIYPPGFDAQEELPAAAHHPRRPARRRRRHLALPLEHAAFAAQGYVVASVNYHGSSRLRLRLPRQHHAPLGRAGAAGRRSRHRLAAEEALGRREARVRHRRQLRRLHGGLDERPRAARALPGLRLPRRLLRLDGDVRRRRLHLARQGTRRLVLGRHGQGPCAEPACLRREHAARPRW